MGEWGIGQPVPRFEDPRLIRGEGNYVGDMMFPGTVPGYVLRSPHAHAKITRIDVSKAKAAPGVLAVLTGEDWDNSGFGDLPVPSGPKRRDGSPLYKPRYRALARDRVRWVGDYVAFVVAETVHQAMDAAELIEVDYEPLPAVVSAAEAIKPGAPLVWDDCPNNISFVHLEGDKAKTDAAFAKADKVVKHHFVINRVTAASMEPRGSIGVYRKYDDHYTIYTTLQRNFTFREELCKFVLKVPEHKVRVVSGDIGGSFGMKSAVYNEAALVLWAAKVTGRPVKWIRTRSEAFLSDGQARDNVTDAELALDKDGNFLGLRVNIIANVGAFLQVGGQSFVGNLGTLAGVYKTPALLCRRHRGAHQHQSGAALSRQRPAGGGLHHRAHGRSRRRRAWHRSGGAAAEELHPAGRDAVQDRAHLHLRLRRFRASHGGSAGAGRHQGLREAPRGIAEARQAARHRHVQHHRARRGARAPKAPRSASIAAARSRCSPARTTRARATRPRSSRSSATGSASIRRTSPTFRATPTRCSTAKAPAARAPPRSAAPRSPPPPTR